jgi:hypothetical protein
MEFESNLKNGYLEAYRLACNNIIKCDHELICANSNSYFDKTNNTIVVDYLNSKYLVYCTSGEVVCATHSQPINVTVKVLILHYLIHAGNRPLTGNLVSFKELSGVSIYYPSFHKRAILPLTKTFAKNIDLFYSSQEKLGGRREGYGTGSATIKVFPMIPVTYVLWSGDEEVADNGTILFDQSVTCFLPGEDIVLAASFGVYEMIKIASFNNSKK